MTMMIMKRTKLIKAILFRNQVGVSLEEGTGFDNQNNLIKIPKNSKLTIIEFSTYDNTVLIKSEHNNTILRVYVSYDYLTDKCVLNTEAEHKIDSVYVYKETSIFNWFRELLSPMSLALISVILALIILIVKI